MSHESITFSVAGASNTERFGLFLAQFMSAGLVIGMNGDLGVGKTALSQGIIHGLGVQSKKIPSPTYSIIHTYSGRLPISHIDLYRIHSMVELEQLGFFEYLNGTHVVLIEWANRIAELTAYLGLQLDMDYLGPQSRRIVLSLLAIGRHPVPFDGTAFSKQCSDMMHSGGIQYG